jgi:hypothetical protein
MRRYHRDVEKLVDDVRQFLTHEQLSDIDRLVYYGEEGEGINYVAWFITDNKVQVPRNLIAEIKTLAGSVNPRDFPPNLDDFAC